MNRRAASDAIRLALVFAGLAPLGFFLSPELFSPAVVSSLLDENLVRRATNSFTLGLITSVLSLILGSAFFVFTMGLPEKTRKACVLLACIPLSFPAFGMATAWLTFVSLLQGMTGRFLWAQDSWISGWLFTLPGTALVLSFVYWPIVFFFLIAFGIPHQRAIESSHLHLPAWNRFWYVWRPSLLRPALLASMLVFGLTLLQFETPSLLQVDVYPLEIFTQFSALMNENLAFLLCVPYVLLAPGFALLFRFMTRLKLQSTSGSIRLQYTRPVWIVFAGSAFLLLSASILLPLAGLVVHASMGNVFETWSYSSDQIFRSILLAGSVAFCVILTGIGLAATQSPWVRSIISVSTFALFVLPGALLAAAWLQLRSSLPIPVTNELLMTFMVSTMIVHALAIGVAAGVLLWQRYGQSPREAEFTFALSSLSRMTMVWPRFMLQPGLVAAGLVFLIAWGELAIPILMHPPGGDTLAMAYYNQLHFGSEPRTAAVGLLVMLLPALTGMLVWMGLRITRTVTARSVT